MLQRYHGWEFFSRHIRLFWLGGGGGVGKGSMRNRFFWVSVPDELRRALDLRFTHGVTYTYKSGGSINPPAAISLSSFRERKEKHAGMRLSIAPWPD